jgi:hypothetical protein
VNKRNNLFPNLWCICTNNLDPVVLHCDDQQISFTFNEEGIDFGVSVVYASTDYVKRRQLWHFLTAVHSSFNIPWACIGDFNAIIGAHEHRGSYSPARLPMEEFHNWSEANNLLHLPTKGCNFTWHNGRKGSKSTDKRLDRVLCKQSWIDVFSSISVSTLTNHKSDHFPLLFNCQRQDVRYISNFKFLKMWSLHKDCFNFVKSVWSRQIFGSLMQILSSKLKILKDELKIWNKNVFGNIQNQVSTAVSKLDDIQNRIQLDGYTDCLMNQESLAKAELETVLNMEEAYWHEKSRVKWHTDSDRNTEFFHRTSKIKQAYKKLSSIRIDDVVTTDPSLIYNHVVNHLHSLFANDDAVFDNGLIEEVIPTLLSDDINSMLTLLPSMSEIHNAGVLYE